MIYPATSPSLFYTKDRTARRVDSSAFRPSRDRRASRVLRKATKRAAALLRTSASAFTGIEERGARESTARKQEKKEIEEILRIQPSLRVPPPSSPASSLSQFISAIE